MLTHWSVAQAGSNAGKNWRSKISVDCPFKIRDIFRISIKLLIFFSSHSHVLFQEIKCSLTEKYECVSAYFQKVNT